MNTEQTAPAADTPEYSAATQDAAVKAAVAADRTRIGQLIDLDAESRCTPALSAAIVDGTSAGDFAIACMKSTAQQQRTALESARSDAAQPEALPQARTDATGAQQKANRGLAFLNRNKKAG